MVTNITVLKVSFVKGFVTSFFTKVHAFQHSVGCARPPSVGLRFKEIPFGLIPEEFGLLGETASSPNKRVELSPLLRGMSL